MNDTMQRFLAGRGPLRDVDRFDGRDGGLAVRRDCHGRKLQEIPFDEAHPVGLVDECGLDRLKPDREALHQLSFDRLPCFVETILEPSWLGDARDVGDNLDAGLADLCLRDVADRLLGVVLP
jgi:hypothetical protein